ncbi:DNA-binding MarR family transcriptional regulator [Kibdelosporangium banguiense]|uniref:DNA-binding MarR family transcriptional regulator n=1 Tax=Kibdelosporangium banguiense TaxID=1365924 RepID=A0ABS4TU03_9PSEU|nr:MarR family transcriptional regulator [Kibdelosporangium banguiense]MBP2327889.1 DNA-binding MarR family transcriptional regulator [Kibdelosporangium banguiense]
MANPPKQKLIDELMLAVTDLQNASDVADQAISDSLGLNRTDARCLSCLITRGPMTAGELAETAGLKPGALTFAVDRLREAGFAERAPDQRDRRRIIIAASDKARHLAEQVWGQTIAEAQTQLDRYTSAQLKLLTGFVREQVELQQQQAHRIRTWNGR